jgi:uncharacterized protein
MEFIVEHEESESKGAFFINEGGSKIAEMTYSKAGTDRIIIDHTEVGPAHRGKKLGDMMVLKAVEMARIKRINIVPLCPFARAFFNKNEELKDVL